MKSVEKFLLKNGIYPSTKGYDYLIEAVELVKTGETKMMRIYKTIAENHNTNTINVTVAIRRLIMKINGGKLGRKINNNAFIKTITRYCYNNPDEIKNVFEELKKK